MSTLSRFFPTKPLSLVLLCVILVGVVFLYYNSGQNNSFTHENKQFYRNNVLEEKVKSLKEGRKQEQVEENNSLLTGELTKEVEEKNTLPSSDGDLPDEINVIITFTNAQSSPSLQRKFTVTVTSMLAATSAPVALHILGDIESQKLAASIMKENVKSTNYRMVHLDIEDITHRLHDIVKDMQNKFSGQKSYYHDALFFMSIAIHRVLPTDIHKVIMLDADLKFHGDIRNLHALFDEFSDTNVMGIAHEAQPVYRHQFYQYRSQNKGTRVGEPPPNGLTGFNSGVLLLDIDRMRSSTVYNSLITAEVAEQLKTKYSFKGHLGDQCFFTLLSLEHEELFYVLPCSWNRQLCTWWKGKGYDDVFDLYFKCEGHINIYHGNCNTKIPD
ncbi:xyloside xylosyltransferase 1-like [Haliotis rufescens]|uniref:xyloside xylosyltransferase 1-like n=1 Tax=Haliotis rufescens TaxID=6454 RepID=UPI00201F3C09|nr:xyloside xylosyltransferase 1-like [Haliotis rufescens]